MQISNIFRYQIREDIADTMGLPIWTITLPWAIRMQIALVTSDSSPRQIILNE